MTSNFIIMMILGTLMYTTSARKLIGLGFPNNNFNNMPQVTGSFGGGGGGGGHIGPGGMEFGMGGGIGGEISVPGVGSIGGGGGGGIGGSIGRDGSISMGGGVGHGIGGHIGNVGFKGEQDFDDDESFKRIHN
ncbi:unnamed protein product [Withania somnifera]